MVILKEEKNSQLFAQWLNSETEEILQFIDGGDLGRPITAEAIAYINQIPIGHIEIIIVRNLQDDHNQWNQLYQGKIWSLCCYLYVVPEQRAKGYGTQIVKQACDQAINDGADLVSLIVAKDNHRARKFYHNVGFTETHTTMIKSGKEFIVSEYLKS
ncbi:GNAT family N-acetyltransferase [Geminocystis sp. GBBB08]|uniref:GNAT family N-acetyltransferase n=1 Tax=Geminocystis sp. GBBB08 TaxID=2604140 RepID=UPI0027E36717|nr:GNAT family N-acetyltransferase [Geminocystis sp. GBBB08]MBL1210486.1 GNAT family N-acetyltransferase [Geminocystis sp. GBBB08]